MEAGLLKRSLPLRSDVMRDTQAFMAFMAFDGETTLAPIIVNSIRLPLLVLDGDMRVITVNQSFLLMFKLERWEVHNRSVYALGDGEWDIPELRQLLATIAPKSVVMSTCEVEQDLPGIGRRTMQLYARTLPCEHTLHTAILLTFEDITELRAKERELKDLLQEKHMLLQESQHRIGNSLQIIASILRIKARAARSEEARLQLQNACHRVVSVALVQQQLQASDPGSTIELGPYLSRLCESLAASLTGDNRPISIRVRAQSGAASSRQAVSIGLIVTELVINALKHAFPDNRSGTVTVAYDAAGLDWILSVSDDGIGSMAGHSNQENSGLGKVIVEALAKQLDARVDVVMDPQGTTVSITQAPFSSARTATTAA